MRVEVISILRTCGALAPSQGSVCHRKMRADGSSEAGVPLSTHPLTFKEGFSFDFASER